MSGAARPETLTADVLVLGAGLAGMRAGIAALEEDADCDVLTLGLGPGSSFSNVNDALGMQVPLGDIEREFFAARVCELAAPGWVDPELAAVLAEEAEPRFRDMQAMSVAFDPDPERPDKPARLPGCFLQDQHSAVVFRGLGHAGERFRRRYAALGGRQISGASVLGLAQVDTTEGKPGRVCGAWVRDAAGRLLVIRAGAVVMALGGPAGLYARSVAGPGSTGVSYGLLQAAGAQLANAGFLQFLWHTQDPLGYFPVHTICVPGVAVLDATGRAVPVPGELSALAESRAGHCPYGHGVADAAIDLFLAAHLHADGAARVRLADGAVVRAAPMAHAGNGGAVVDAHGFTGVAGLYACGECATGMHGANRIGGAMVTATQVFGARAGRAAARESRTVRRVNDLWKNIPPPKEPGMALVRRRKGDALWLADTLQREASLVIGPGLKGFEKELISLISIDKKDVQGHASLRTALSVVQSLLSVKKR